MAFVGGTYSLPAGYFASTGGTIVITQHNPIFEDVATGLNSLLLRNGNNSMSADLPMNSNRVTNMAAATALTDAIQATQIQKGSVQFAADSGAADAYVVTLSPAATAYTTGMRIWFSTANANTGASTLNVNGLGVKSIVKGVSDALAAADIAANKIVDVVYDGTNFVMQNPADSSLSTASTTEVLTGTDTAKAVTPDALAALWEKGSDIASAGTISVDEGGYFDITGTTTITDIDFATDKAGREAELQFDGILTLTHGANLVLPGAANITTAAGDIARFRSEDGADKVVCTNYQRAADTPGVGSWTEVNAGTFALNTKFTEAHSLGAKPEDVQVWLENTIVELNYSIGQRTRIDTLSDEGSGSRAVNIVIDATNVYVLVASAGPKILNFTTLGNSNITVANWDVIVRFRS